MPIMQSIRPKFKSPKLGGQYETPENSVNEMAGENTPVDTPESPELRSINPESLNYYTSGQGNNTGIAGGTNDGATALSAANSGGNPGNYGNREEWRDWWMSQGAMTPEDAVARFKGRGGTLLGGQGLGRTPHGEVLDLMINMRGAQAGRGMVTPGWTPVGGGGMSSVTPGNTGTGLPQEAPTKIPKVYMPSDEFRDRLRQRDAGYGNIVRA